MCTFCPDQVECILYSARTNAKCQSRAHLASPNVTVQKEWAKDFRRPRSDGLKYLEVAGETSFANITAIYFVPCGHLENLIAGECADYRKARTNW